MDEELDRALGAALDELRAARPAADFLPRLRAHVESQPSRQPIQWWILVAASASAVAAGVVVAALVRAPRHDAVARMLPLQAPAGAAAAQHVPPLPHRDYASGDYASAEPSRSRRAPRIVRAPDNAAAASSDSDSAVLVPPGQLAAVGRLVAAINDGDEHAAESVRRLERGTGEIVIEPIRIEPVVVDPLKESL